MTALRLLLTCVLWFALVGVAHGSAERTAHWAHSGRSTAEAIREVGYGARASHDACQRELPADPEPKAKGERPPLEKLAKALGWAEAWLGGDAAFHGSVPGAAGVSPKQVFLVPNARAPPTGH